MKLSTIFPLLKGDNMTEQYACRTIKVKPWGKGQGDFVEINAEDFNSEIHELFDGEVAPVVVSTEDAAKVFDNAKAMFDKLTPEQRDELQVLMNKRAEEAAAEINSKFDHDNDGKAGGSKSKAEKAAEKKEAEALAVEKEAAEAAKTPGDPANGWGKPE